MLEPSRSADPIPYSTSRLWMRVRELASGPHGEPTDRREQAVLASVDEWRAARDEAYRLGLPRHPDLTKSWDTLLALGAILRRVPRGGPVLDAGAERYSALLPSLWLYGYTELHGINLAFDRERRRGPIVYTPGDATCAPYPDASFAAVTCLSVIEHGVDVERFLDEAARLLRPGGVLVISTDYWPEPVDTHGARAYGVPIKIFTRDGLAALIAAAERRGLRPSTPIDRELLRAAPRARPVTWARHGLAYTFALTTLIRD